MCRVGDQVFLKSLERLDYTFWITGGNNLSVSTRSNELGKRADGTAKNRRTKHESLWQNSALC